MQNKENKNYGKTDGVMIKHNAVFPSALWRKMVLNSRRDSSYHYSLNQMRRRRNPGRKDGGGFDLNPKWWKRSKNVFFFYKWDHHISNFNCWVEILLLVTLEFVLLSLFKQNVYGTRKSSNELTCWRKGSFILIGVWIRSPRIVGLD